ncbi:hypothetical protein V2G26_020420 [Clonostachys chloroleuca]
MSYTLQASRCYPVSNRPELEKCNPCANRLLSPTSNHCRPQGSYGSQCVEPYTFLEYKVYTRSRTSQ